MTAEENHEFLLARIEAMEKEIEKLKKVIRQKDFNTPLNEIEVDYELIKNL